jgi:hypothetical protein
MKKYVTDFRKFIVERLKNEKKKDKPELEVDMETEVENDVPKDDQEFELDDDGEEINSDTVDELLTEWKKIKRKYDLLRRKE